MSETIDVQHLDVGFEKDNKNIIAIDDLNFQLHPGETVALLGESGCGKSLTSLALMRLLPDSAAYGRDSQILFGQEDLLQLPENLMRGLRGKRLAIIFQEPMTSLNPVLTIGQQLAESLSRDNRLTKAELREQMLRLLSEVEIPNPAQRLDQYPHQLSGGQKQRVVIAMALAGRPDVLIADEPTTALDATTQAQILSLLQCLQERYQMSILLITHDLGVVKSIASRVYVMYAGQLVESSPVSAFASHPLHPYVQQLLVSLPSYARRGERLQAIPGGVPALEERPSGCRFHPRCAHAFEPCSTIEPELQTLSHDRRVRCHLYPKHKKPPQLTEVNHQWVTKKQQNEVLVSVQDLSVYFYPPRPLLSRSKPPFKAVDGLSFDLHRSKTLALVGESGCGKSTVSRAILRLQLITKGNILYKGMPIQSLKNSSLRGFRKNVQIIFQDPFSSMNPRMTVADILAEGMLAQRMSSHRVLARQLELLSHVNLPKSSLSRYPHQFSGGQRQRICIARALATNPEVLVCDEPTSALDISVQAQILNLLKSLQYELGLSYLFITHNMDVVSYMADEVLVMREGRAIEKGTCEEVLSSPKMAYTRMLLSSVHSTEPRHFYDEE